MIDLRPENEFPKEGVEMTFETDRHVLIVTGPKGRDSENLFLIGKDANGKPYTTVVFLVKAEALAIAKKMIEFLEAS